ncbi:MAG: putative acyltransferase [Flavobacteriales bacterium]|jgi:predicted acyltransferase
MRYDSLGSLPAYIDRTIFGIEHLWPYGTTQGLVTYDPEGIIATFPACINVLVGCIVGHSYKQNKTLKLPIIVIWGVMLIIAGLILSPFFPMIKKIWSTSFAATSSGFSLLALVCVCFTQKNALCAALVKPCKAFGANALLAFVIAILMISILDMKFFSDEAQSVSLRELGFQTIHYLIPSQARNLVHSYFQYYS